MTNNSYKIENDNMIKKELYNQNKYIEKLNKERKENKETINKLKDQLLSIKIQNSDLRKSQILLGDVEQENILLKEQISKLQEDIINLHKQFKEEKRKEENNYNIKIKELNVQIDILKGNLISLQTIAQDKNNIVDTFENMIEQSKKEIKMYKENLEQNEVEHKIKFSKFKSKMISQLNEAKMKFDGFKLQYDDLLQKLAPLMNQKLIAQIEFQENEINQLKETNDSLVKKIKN